MLLSTLKKKMAQLPKAPGVYVFKDASGRILYIGKATSLRDRVRSYFSGTSYGRMQLMVPRISKIETRQTDSVLEALILEANLIKKHQPKFNVREKDDKSFCYAVVTKEEFPRILILRKTDLNKRTVLSEKDSPLQLSNTFGPYTSKKQLETALKIIRRIFPYHAAKQKTEKGCLDHQIGLCPGPYAGEILRKDYLKNIRNIKLILRGKKKSLIATLKEEMNAAAKKLEFEKAEQLRRKIFALEHIRDTALISHEEKFPVSQDKIRIEAYDISNISGNYTVGAMVVFENREPNKSQYRKFKIKTVRGIDDVGAMREVLLRRFRNQWPLPDLIIVDGGKGHLNMAREVLRKFKKNIPIIAAAKGPKRKKLEIHGETAIIDKKNTALVRDNNFIKAITTEAHRFAITYHRKLRSKELSH